MARGCPGDLPGHPPEHRRKTGLPTWPLPGMLGTMTWKAPEVTRIDGPLTAGERETLNGYLSFFRSTLLRKCAGLTGRRMA